MREALASPDYFGNYLVGDSWARWRVLLIAIMGEPLTPDERVIFKTLTGRSTEPTEPLREFWGIMGRRSGKSRATAVLASFLAVCCDHRSALAPGEIGALPILAASQKQAGQLFRFVSGIFESVPAFAGMVTDATADTLRLVSGVNIVVTTASWRTVRSITAISAIGDEIAFWRSEDSTNPDAEILNALKPALLTTGGMFIGISSPYSRKGEVYKAFRKHYGSDGDSRRLVAKAATVDMNPALDDDAKAEIDLAYKEDPAAASAEYGGEFRSDIEGFVTPEALASVIDKGVAERPYEGRRHVAFVDPSGGSKDSMTLAIAHIEGTTAVLDVLREVRPPFSPEGVVIEFAALLKSYGLKNVTGDRYGGSWTQEPFTRHGIRYCLAEKNRSEIYQSVLPLINSKRAALLDNPRLTAQFLGLERRTSSAGRDNIDHARGGHDDLANAAAGALVLAANVKPRMTAEQWSALQRLYAGHRGR